MSESERVEILVGTDDGLYRVDEHGGARVDELAGREVRALERAGDGCWAVVGGRELWQKEDGRAWRRVATAPAHEATCLGQTSVGLLVGTAGAHLLRLHGHRLAPVYSFDDAEGRGAWYTPWGAPADVRSISAGGGERIYVNIHVGGVLRSTDGAVTWRPMLDIEHDVHQVLAPAARPDLVLVAAFDGFGLSEDAGASWRWENEGLHAHYCRAVVLDGDMVFLSASTGHHGRRAAVYRRRLDGGPFERCCAGLPEWFAGNVDTGCLAARDGTVVIATEDGCVYVSSDAGSRWDLAAKGLAAARAVALG